MNTDPPKRQEITDIKALKNNNAPGHDNLNAKPFKADHELSAKILLPLLTTEWKEEEVPNN